MRFSYSGALNPDDIWLPHISGDPQDESPNTSQIYHVCCCSLQGAFPTDCCKGERVMKKAFPFNHLLFIVIYFIFVLFLFYAFIFICIFVYFGPAAPTTISIHNNQLQLQIRRCGSLSLCASVLEHWILLVHWLCSHSS